MTPAHLRTSPPFAREEERETFFVGFNFSWQTVFRFRIINEGSKANQTKSSQQPISKCI